MTREAAVSRIASLWADYVADLDEPDKLDPRAFRQMIMVCEEEDVDEDRVDVIVVGFRQFMEQEVDHTCQQLRQQLEAFRGL